MLEAEPLSDDDDVMNLADEIVRLRARVAELEDVCVEIAPFAACHEVLSTTTLTAPTPELVMKKAHQFKRDSLYLNKFVFRRAAMMVREKLIANGQEYIFS